MSAESIEPPPNLGNTIRSNKYVTFGLNNSSSSSGEKDALLDQYEAKMGELLHCQQELCSVKNQLSQVMEHSREVESFYQAHLLDCEQQITELTARNTFLEQNSKQSVIQPGSPDSSKWIQKCKELESELTEKDNQLEDMKLKVRTMEDDKKMYLSERAGLLAKNAEFIKEINSLNKQLAEFNMLNVTFTQQGKTFNELKDENTKLHQELLLLKRQLAVNATDNIDIQGNIDEKDRQISKLKKNYSDILGQLHAANEQISDLHKQKDHIEQLSLSISQEKSVKDKELEDIKKRYERVTKRYSAAKEALSSVMHAFPTIATSDELKKHMEELPEIEKQNRKTLRELRRDNERLASRAAEADELEDLSKRQHDRIQSLLAQRGVCSSFSRVNKEMAYRLSSLVGEPRVSLRSIILMSVMLSRWRQLPSTPIEYTNKGLNWWWLSTSQTEISVEKIEAKFKRADELEKENELLKEEIEKQKDIKPMVCEQNENDELTLRFLEQQVRELNEELSSVIGRNEYDSKVAQYREKKEELKKATVELSELRKEHFSDLERIQELEFAVEEKDSLNAELQAQIEQLNLEKDELREEVLLLQKATNQHRKDYLSLERGAIKNEEERRRNNVEFRALMTENELLFAQINRKQARFASESTKCLRTLL